MNFAKTKEGSWWNVISEMCFLHFNRISVIKIDKYLEKQIKKGEHSENNEFGGTDHHVRENVLFLFKRED